MKVITKGKGWHRRVTCKGCEAVLEVDGGDLHWDITDEDTRSISDELDVEGTYYVICPECELHNKLKAKDIPENIREFLRSR